MFIKTFPVGAFQCNCSIIADMKSGEAMIIDPGDEAEKIIESVKSNNFDVKYIIHTHAHIDHIGATKEVKNKLSGEICLHKDDSYLYENMAMQAKVLGVKMDCDVLPVSKFIEHGDEIECQGGLLAQVLFTPGHTPGSVSFLVDNVLFSGDTLFRGSIGRTDLWGGDHNQLIASIREKLLKLPPKTIVIPGHGPQTSVGFEAKRNPFFQ